MQTKVHRGLLSVIQRKLLRKDGRGTKKLSTFYIIFYYVHPIDLWQQHHS